MQGEKVLVLKLLGLFHLYLADPLAERDTGGRGMADTSGAGFVPCGSSLSMK